MFRYEDLAKQYETLLGNNFSVKVNNEIDITNVKTMGVMYPSEVPFALDLNTVTTLDLYFDFYVNVNTEFNNNDFNNSIRAILGKHSGEFISNDVTYTFDSFLKYDRPISAPVLDTSEFKQLISLSGSCFISAKDSGVQMSNDIKTYISFDNIDFYEVYPTSINVSNVRDTDAPNKVNKNQSSAIAKTQGVSRNLTLLAMRDYITRELEKLIEITDTSELNESVYIKRVYPDYGSTAEFSITKESILTSATILEQPGAFLTLSLTLQPK